MNSFTQYDEFTQITNPLFRWIHLDQQITHPWKQVLATAIRSHGTIFTKIGTRGGNYNGATCGLICLRVWGNVGNSSMNNNTSGGWGNDGGCGYQGVGNGGRWPGWVCWGSHSERWNLESRPCARQFTVPYGRWARGSWIQGSCGRRQRIGSRCSLCSESITPAGGSARWLATQHASNKLNEFNWDEI